MGVRRRAPQCLSFELQVWKNLFEIVTSNGTGCTIKRTFSTSTRQSAQIQFNSNSDSQSRAFETALALATNVLDLGLHFAFPGDCWNRVMNSSQTISVTRRAVKQRAGMGSKQGKPKLNTRGEKLPEQRLRVDKMAND